MDTDTKRITLLTDEEVPEGTERQARHTPAGEEAVRVKQWATLFANQEPPVLSVAEGKYRGLVKSGVLEILSHTLDETGLKLEFRVTSAPNDLAHPNDLVTVTLERGPLATRRTVHTIVVLQPTEDENSFVVTITYQLRQLVKLLNLNAPLDALPGALVDLIKLESPEIGVKAEWLIRKGTGNAPIHFSGGIDSKGFSGVIRLRPATLDDLKATEGVRNSQWNLAEPLKPGRPVFDKHRVLLLRDGQMATSLEAESEYFCDEKIWNIAVSKMAGLLDTPTRWPSCDILKVKFDTVSGVKDYTDTYFDLPKLGCPLLKAGVVLRRRSVVGDVEGTYLLVVKGRTKSFNKRPIRLTAQANLNAAVAETGQLSELLQALLLDTQADNVISRVLHDALGSSATTLLSQEMPAKVLTLKSRRTKYQLSLANSTRIEFSADCTTVLGKEDFRPFCSFELGLEHPGLVIAPVQPFGSAVPSQPTPTVLLSTALFSRPYHIPADLEELNLDAKQDYAQLVKLRDVLITQVFGLTYDQLSLGGTKATTIARMLGMLG